MNNRIKGFLLNPFTLFLTAWAVLNLFQARLTPLNNDEAYYNTAYKLSESFRENFKKYESYANEEILAGAPNLRN